MGYPTGLKIATFLAPNMRPAFESAARAIGEALDVETSFEVGRSYKQLDAGEFDAAFVCGLAYVVIDRRAPGAIEPIAAPVPVGERYQGRPIYFSDVVVHCNSDFASFDDLRGATFAYNEPLSHSGFGVMRYHLARLETGQPFFGRALRADFHESAIRLVEGRQVDTAAIDSVVLENELKLYPELGSSLRVVETIGPSTIQPFVAKADLPAEIQDGMRSALIGMADGIENRIALNEHFIARFDPIDDAAYADVRDMLDAADRAGITLGD